MNVQFYNTAFSSLSFSLSQSVQKTAKNVCVRPLLLLDGPGGGEFRLAGAGLQGRRPGHPGQCVPGLQRVYLRVRPDRLGQVVHDDGQPGEQGHHSAAVRRTVCVDRGQTDGRAELQGRGVLHGDLQRKGARPARPEDQQAVAEGAGTQRPGTVRGRAVPAGRHVIYGRCPFPKAAAHYSFCFHLDDYADACGTAGNR